MEQKLTKTDDLLTIKAGAGKTLAPRDHVSRKIKRLKEREMEGTAKTGALQRFKNTVHDTTVLQSST